MKTKLFVIAIALLATTIGVAAQGSRNPLNREPATLAFHNSDALKEMSSMTLYLADGQPFEKTEFTYGETGLRTGEQTSRFNASTGEWRNVSKEIITHAKGATVTETYMWAGFAWSPVSRTETTLDRQGNRLSSRSFSISSSERGWEKTPYMQTVWQRNANGQVTELLKEYTNGKPSVRIKYTYNTDGELSEELYQTVQNDSRWRDGGRYSYSSAASGRRLTAVSQYASQEGWASDGRIVNELSSEGLLVRSEYYAPDTEKLSAYYLYTYLESVPTGETGVAATFQVRVYPNPATGSFSVTVPAELEDSPVRVFNTAGKLLLTVPSSGGGATTQVDASTLPKGVYFVKVGATTQKVVLN
jgi:hypothetical protein